MYIISVLPKMAKQKITAIIYDRRGHVLSVGQNSYVKTHTLQAHYAQITGEPYKIYLHAEIHAITKCKNLKKAHKISIFRYDRKGRPVSASPCPICSAAIKESGIELIEHT